MPNVPIQLGEKFGRLMNFGDGVYGGQFVGGMYAEAFFEKDIVKIIEAGLRCIPEESQYAEMVRDMLKWKKENKDDWQRTWKLVEEKYHKDPRYTHGLCSPPGGKGVFGIDAKLNGAYILMGLLYGEGDIEQTVEIAIRCGQDSDCNPSNAGGILFTSIGYTALPARFTADLDLKKKFSHTPYDFPTLIQVCTKLARQAVKQSGGKTEKDDTGKEVLIIPNKTIKPSELLKTRDIRIRDPYIYADPKSKMYYMYAQAANRQNSGFTGVEVYTSKDLCHWHPPRTVLTLPDDAGIRAVWAPEMHTWNGRYYLFVTLTYDRTLTGKKPVELENWPAMHVRGTHIFQADSPLGPFIPIKSSSHTPKDWMALDGTLFVEKDTPYMIFCHEWVQLVDGTMDYVQLKADFSDTVGTPRLMFKASAAPGAEKSPDQGKVTDGCFLYRSPKSKRLFMIWSTFIPGNGYCVVLTHSKSGTIAGPWTEQKLIYTKNGGHGMIFESLDKRLMMALHQPNSGSREQLHLFEVTDDGETLKIKEEVKLK
jgi:GH43 family beta-xylosidase